MAGIGCASRLRGTSGSHDRDPGGRRPWRYLPAMDLVTVLLIILIVVLVLALLSRGRW